MNQENSFSKSTYLPQLDGLRAFAVASVAFSHWVPPRLHLGLPWGDGGVQLFFVLSGFLITSILLRCRKSQDKALTLQNFYMRRLLRIFPAFYAMLAIAYFLNFEPVRETIIWHLSYLSNFYFFFRQGWHGEISHFWSLAVEEQFYLFWPLIIIYAPSRFILAAAIVLVVIGTLSQLLLPQIFYGVKLLSVLPNYNFDAIGLGALIACGESNKWCFKFVRVCKFGLAIYFSLFVLRTAGLSIPMNDALEHYAMLMSFVWLTSSAAVGFGGVTKNLLSLPQLFTSEKLVMAYTSFTILPAILLVL